MLRAAGVPPYHKVPTYTIVRRLEDAGLLAAAEAALRSNNSSKEWRFLTAESRGGIDADDAESRALLKAIGADPDVVLAPV